MGEMADMLLDQMEDWEWDERGWDPRDPCVLMWMSIPLVTLVNATSRARTEREKGIRRYYAEHKRLSAKQQWCLAFWAASHDIDIHDYD